MDFVITTFCNLGCRNCWSLMPYYKAPFHFDLNEIKTNLKKLSDCDKVKNIQLIGGETLLHPDINEIISYISTLNFDIISIYTNGTIIPKDFEIALEKMDSRFSVYITEYGNKSTKVKELQELCDKYNVYNELNTFGNIHGSKPGSEWIKAGSPTFKPLPKIEENTCGQIMSCMGNKVYKCQRFGHLDLLGITELADDEWCYIDDIAENYDRLKERGYTKTCNYCLRGTKLAVNIPKGS